MFYTVFILYKKLLRKNKISYYFINMKLEKNSALLVIDAQNKYKYIMKPKSILNIKKIVQKFYNDKIPIYFTQWSRCHRKHNCTRKHKNETINNKIAYNFKHKRPKDLYRLEKTRKYKCPSYNCNIIDEIKSYSNKENTFISDKMDSLAGNKKLLNRLNKTKIKTLYIIGGWGEHCIISTALGCINTWNKYPIIIEDAIFGVKKHEKIIPLLTDTIVSGKHTKDLL